MTEDELVGAIRSAHEEGRVAYTQHALSRMRLRGVTVWQVEDIVGFGDIDSVTLMADPDPRVNFIGDLPDGSEAVVICAYDTERKSAVVTVYVVGEE